MKRTPQRAAEIDGLSAQVLSSLTQGEHRSVSHQRLRGLLGLAVLLVASLRRPAPDVALRSRVLEISSNPVAHGARLVACIQRSIPRAWASSIGNSRAAGSGVQFDQSFPGLGIHGLATITSLARLRLALAIRSEISLKDIRSTGLPPLYSEFLYLAQSIRFLAARALLERASGIELVLVDWDRSAYCRPFVHEAKRRGIHVATFVHGSPTKSHYLPLLASTALVWGEAQSDWFEQVAEESSRLIVGRPEVLRMDPSPHALDRAVICHSKEILSTTELMTLRSQIRELQATGIPVELRLHPSSTRGELDDHWARVAADTDSIVETREPFVESLNQHSLVICISSTAAVEGVLLGVPVVVAADESRVLPCDLQEIACLGAGITLDELIRPTRIRRAFVQAASARVASFTGLKSERAIKIAVENLCRSYNPSQIN